MNDKCPKCGAGYDAGGLNRFHCGSFWMIGDSGTRVLNEARVCISNQRDALILENAALRKAQKTAWDEGWEDRDAQCSEKDIHWDQSIAKDVHDGISPP